MRALSLIWKTAVDLISVSRRKQRGRDLVLVGLDVSDVLSATPAPLVEVSRNVTRRQIPTHTRGKRCPYHVLLTSTSM